MAAASSIARTLSAHESWKKAKVVLLYSALKNEIDLVHIMQLAQEENKTIAVPQFEPTTGVYFAAKLENNSHRWVQGPFGVLEPAPGAVPISWNLLDLALVPGVAFDLRGVRLGRGKGFYDRMLAEVKGIKCGVAYDQQVVQELPYEPHDVQMDCLLTPTRWLDFPRLRT